MSTTRRACLGFAAAAGGGLMAGAAEPPAETDFLAMMAKRQSVRRFKPDPVPADHLRRILDAARRAPSSGNQQPWKFLVVQDPDKIARMKELCLEGFESRIQSLPAPEQESRRKQMGSAMDGYFSAPVYVVVLTDSQSTYPSYNHHDGPLAAGYLMLAARALGYGTVYITDSIPEQVTRDALSIPERYKRVCITPIGVPEAWPDPKPKKELDELVAFERL